MDNVEKELEACSFVESESYVTEQLNDLKDLLNGEEPDFLADATLTGLAMFFDGLTDSPELLHQYIASGTCINTGTTWYFIPEQ